MLSLTYVSSAVELLDGAYLARMLAGIRPKNEALGITGLLLYRDGNIIQVLEGPDEAVEATFRTVESDPRHRDVIVVLREAIEERAFADWSMGFRELGPDEVDELPGYSTFLRRPLGQELGPHAGSAYLLLEAFRDTVR